LPALPRDIQTGQSIVQQGIALRSSDIDLIWVHGYGFPPGKGGPMFYADHLGPQTIHDAMCKLHDAHGQIFWRVQPGSSAAIWRVNRMLSACMHESQLNTQFQAPLMVSPDHYSFFENS